MKVKCRNGVYSKYTLKDRLTGSTAFWICMAAIAMVIAAAAVATVLKLPE